MQDSAALTPAPIYYDQDRVLKSLPFSLISVDTSSSALTPPTDGSKLTVKMGSQSRTILKTDGTLRCLYMGRATFDSRLSAPVVDSARILVEKFCNALLENLGGGATRIRASLQMVVISEHRIRICFDLFLGDCDAQLRKAAADLLRFPKSQ